MPRRRHASASAWTVVSPSCTRAGVLPTSHALIQTLYSAHRNYAVDRGQKTITLTFSLNYLPDIFAEQLP